MSLGKHELNQLLLMNSIELFEEDIPISLCKPYSGSAKAYSIDFSTSFSFHLCHYFIDCCLVAYIDVHQRKCWNYQLEYHPPKFILMAFK